jgi:hypothetical protein
MCPASWQIARSINELISRYCTAGISTQSTRAASSLLPGLSFLHPGNVTMENTSTHRIVRHTRFAERHSGRACRLMGPGISVPVGMRETGTKHRAVHRLHLVDDRTCVPSTPLCGEVRGAQQTGEGSNNRRRNTDTTPHGETSIWLKSIPRFAERQLGNDKRPSREQIFGGDTPGEKLIGAINSTKSDPSTYQGNGFP